MMDLETARPLIMDSFRKSHLPGHAKASEKKAEEFVGDVFKNVLGWDLLGSEVNPQKKIRSYGRSTRVDYSFQRAGRIRPDFYVEVKRFSESLDNPEHVAQTISYGKSSRTRWVVLTNFHRWRVFNSDYFDDLGKAEMFEFDIADIANPAKSRQTWEWLRLFSREEGGDGALEAYAKANKHWKEAPDIEVLLTDQLIDNRRALMKAIKEQNPMLFDSDNEEDIDEDKRLGACVQHIFDRLIFARSLEDNGLEPDLRMEEMWNAWQKDRRPNFYKDNLHEYWRRMRKRFDSNIFDDHRIDGLSIKKEDFMPVFESFYYKPGTRLRYYFDVIPLDVLGHTYENYLSYKDTETAKRAGIEEEKNKRKQSGIYYTPKFLVEFLVSQTLGRRLATCRTPAEALRLRIVDPACGSGTFLVRAFEEFHKWYVEQTQKTGAGERGFSEAGRLRFEVEVLENCIYGVDLDLKAVRLTELNLFLRMIDIPESLPQLRIFNKNSLVSELLRKDTKPFRLEKLAPLVVESGGFDIVLGNPPWEKWKPNSDEFFEDFVEDGTFRDWPTQKKKKMKDELLKRKGVKADWDAEEQKYEIYSEYFRENYQFQRGDGEDGAKRSSGDIDLYKLFTERAYQLLKEGGECGFVIPSGIYTDLGTKGLRQMLFEKCKIEGLYSFENQGHKIFAAVHASWKPTLLVFQKGGKTDSFPAGFMLHTEEDLKAAETNPTIIPIEFVKSSSPALSVLEVKTPKDMEIVKKLLRHPMIGTEMESTWNLSF